MRYVDTLTVLKHANQLNECASQIESDSLTPNGRAILELVRQCEYFAASMQFHLDLPEPGQLPKPAKRPLRKTRRKSRNT